MCREDPTYADILQKARQNLALEELGIKDVRVRKVYTGGILLEIPGTREFQSDIISTAPKEYITRGSSYLPKGGIRLSGLDDSITVEEVRKKVCELGVCNPDLVRVSLIKWFPFGARTVWIQAPLRSAIKISKMEKINIGWSRARVALFQAKPLQCFKCFEFGHPKNRCANTIDRSDVCFRCGTKVHVVGTYNTIRWNVYFVDLVI